VCLESVAISTESLQVSRVVVPTVPVYVVYIQLTDMYWLEVAVLAVIFLVDCVWVDRLVVVSLIDSFTSIPTGKWVVLIAQFNLCMAAYGTDSGTECFVNLR